MTDRSLPFDGIDNFRDYGGYQTPNGRLRMGRLFRSAHHGAATDADLDLLGTLNIASLFDFRSKQERALAPSRRPAGFAAVIHETDIGEGYGPPGLMNQLRNARTGEEAQEAYSEAYRVLAVSPGLIVTYRAYFAALVSENTATVIHCNAGKDRTGIAAALLHRALGVHEDDIMEDYLLTNSVRGAEERVALNSGKLRELIDPNLSDDVATAYSVVMPQYLHAAYKVIEDRPGGLSAYMRDELGVDSQWRERAERLLLE